MDGINVMLNLKSLAVFQLSIQVFYGHNFSGCKIRSFSDTEIHSLQTAFDKLLEGHVHIYQKHVLNADS